MRLFRREGLWHVGLLFALEQVTMKKILLRLIVSAGSVVCLLPLLFTSCGSSSGSSTTATSYYSANGLCYSNTGTQVASTLCTSSYYMSNGLCYAAGGVQVATTMCSSSYYTSNGLCYSTGGVQVSPIYCSSTTSSLVAQYCVGYYYLNSVEYYCNGTNCSGYTLISATTGQSTTCR